jgi:hypothetical protein
MAARSSPNAGDLATPVTVHTSERRRSARGTINGEPARSRLVALILGTYTEMPGLTLDLSQAARLFGLRDITCRVVLDALVDANQLHRSPDGKYRASSSGSV